MSTQLIPKPVKPDHTGVEDRGWYRFTRGPEPATKKLLLSDMATDLTGKVRETPQIGMALPVKCTWRREFELPATMY